MADPGASHDGRSGSATGESGGVAYHVWHLVLPHGSCSPEAHAGSYEKYVVNPPAGTLRHSPLPPESSPVQPPEDVLRPEAGPKTPWGIDSPCQQRRTRASGRAMARWLRVFTGQERRRRERRMGTTNEAGGARNGPRHTIYAALA